MKTLAELRSEIVQCWARDGVAPLELIAEYQLRARLSGQGMAPDPGKGPRVAVPEALAAAAIASNVCRCGHGAFAHRTNMTCAGVVSGFACTCLDFVPRNQVYP